MPVSSNMPPTDSVGQIEEIKLSGYQMMVLAMATKLLAHATLEDFVMMSRNTQPTQYSGKNFNSRTSKSGGKPPPEYAGIESLQDMRAELGKNHKDRDYDHIARCYLHLSSILRY